MAKQGFSFEFDPPNGWREFEDGSRLVFQGAGNEELIISGATLAGGGDPKAYEATLDALHANAIKAMRNAVAHPELVVDWPAREGATLAGLRYETLNASTRDGAVLFMQGAVFGDDGVLLITFEAPAKSSSSEFDALIRSVRPVRAFDA